MHHVVDSEDEYDEEATGNDRVNGVGSSLCFFCPLPHPNLLSGVEVELPYSIYTFHSDFLYITD